MDQHESAEFGEEFIDFGIPLEDFREIINCGEIPDEWANSQPEGLTISQADEFADLGIPVQDLHDIINCVEIQDEWANPEPVWDSYQIGRGEPVAGPSGLKNRKRKSTVSEASAAETSGEGAESSRLDDAIIIEEKSRRINKKYKAVEIIYQARIEPEKLPENVQGAPVAAIVSSVRELFYNIIRRTTDSHSPVDLIRFCIRAEGLDKPISTNLMPVSDVTVEKLLSAVSKVVQSKEEIRLDTGFYVDVLIIERPVGGGRNRKIINIQLDRLTKKSILTIPYDDEGLCCAKAIVYALAHLNDDKPLINALRDRRRPALMNKARELHRAANVPPGPCTFSEIAVFEHHLDTQIAVLSSDNFNQVSYKGVDRTKRINLFLHDGHYDVVKSLKGFFGSNHYCERCEKPYANAYHHHCANACFVCLRMNCVPDNSIRCEDCDRLCKSEDCFSAHKSLTANETFSLCDRVYQCRSCCKVIRREDCPKEMHRCGTKKCPSCNKFVDITEHKCYLGKVEAKAPSDHIIFFDFESDQSTGEHVVNLAVAQYADGIEVIFAGYSACTDFCAWLFAPKHKGYTAIAHNMKGFDGQFLLHWLLEQGMAPEVIPNGSLIMYIAHKTLGIRIIDSLNFLPMALSKLPACFGLSELKKGYFPHLFNTAQNQTYVGPLPDASHYSPDSMTPTARTAFIAWHKEHENDVFDFQKEILEYCRSDVDILRRCFLEFRKQFLEVAGVDPSRYITIASACMATYRNNHIQPNTIAMIPVHGYINHVNYSPDSIRWLDFVAFSEGLQIQHALNSRGERKIAGLFVDGFCEESKIIYQYHGCFYHGCSSCYDGDETHPVKNVSMGSLRQKTEENTLRLRAEGYRVVEMWEHSFKIMKNEDPELQSFLKSHQIQDRLNPRDAFFGGRTNAIKLFHEGDIRYVDFTSLYPWVNKYCIYPVGHPTIITEGCRDVEDYFGLIHCRVIPPRSLYLPVLPYRCRGKLMFPLCRSCADGLAQNSCRHTDDERALIGTWVSEELKLAKKKGYRFTHIYEVYHFEETTDSLFSSYIDLFLKIKQESSGWPAECDSEEEKAQYIRLYERKEGVKLDANNISKNPGRRQVAKLALNSFWGRWGMNTNKGQLTYVNSLPNFNKIMTDSKKNIKDVYLPTKEVVAINWESTKDFVEQDATTNVFLAAFTTAWARLKLYGEMDKLGRSVLYHDTDSIIYVSDGKNDPPLGNFLGEFTDELDGDSISTFVSGGPKNYAYKTKSEKTCCKVRGFTLNFRNSNLLNFDSVKMLVCGLDNDSIPIKNPAKIKRDGKKRKVFNEEETKLYRVVYDKRVIQEDLTTLPYGY